MCVCVCDAERLESQKSLLAVRAGTRGTNGSTNILIGCIFPQFLPWQPIPVFVYYLCLSVYLQVLDQLTHWFCPCIRL